MKDEDWAVITFGKKGAVLSYLVLLSESAQLSGPSKNIDACFQS